ncbi:hypothetical protein ACFP4H_20780 [Pseudophaeobacter arcticus]|uniref:hypothetical protein n=1 Tax=Pseudophaeobacter arcticus TaxID=385492 RepID=UPI0012B5FB4D|nr:hypothetical protein [Pseudophaeobacter arcticus]
MRLLLATLVSSFLLSACGMSQAEYDAYLASFRAGPSDAERANYSKIGVVTVNGDRDNYSAFHVTVRRSQSLPEAYFNVVLRPVPERPDGIVPDHRIPDVILADISNDLSQAAYEQVVNGGGTGSILKLAKEVARRTYCVGRRVGHYDLKGTRISDPESLAKIMAATGGNVLGADVSHLNLKRMPIPVVERREWMDSGHYWAEVRLKC